MDAILDFTTQGNVAPVIQERASTFDAPSTQTVAPSRMDGNHLYRYSKVLEGHLGSTRARVLPTCPHHVWATAFPINCSAPS